MNLTAEENDQLKIAIVYQRTKNVWNRAQKGVITFPVSRRNAEQNIEQSYHITLPSGVYEVTNFDTSLLKRKYRLFSLLNQHLKIDADKLYKEIKKEDVDISVIKIKLSKLERGSYVGWYENKILVKIYKVNYKWVYSLNGVNRGGFFTAILGMGI